MNIDVGKTEADQQEYKDAFDRRIQDVNGALRLLDDKNRIRVEQLTDRELANESLILLRGIGDALEALGQNPMLRALPGVSGLLGGKK